MRGFIFVFSLQLWPCWRSGAKGHSWGSKGGVLVGKGRGDLTEGCLLGIPTPPPPLSVGGTVMPASLQASVLPVYWLFYTVKSNKTELLSYNHRST